MLSLLRFAMHFSVRKDAFIWPPIKGNHFGAASASLTLEMLLWPECCDLPPFTAIFIDCREEQGLNDISHSRTMCCLTTSTVNETQLWASVFCAAIKSHLSHKKLWALLSHCDVAKWVNCQLDFVAGKDLLTLHSRKSQDVVYFSIRVPNLKQQLQMP